MTDCVFCRILAGELPGTFVHRDDDVAAFMDIQPVNPGHVLVVPVRHATRLADTDAESAGRLMAVAHRVAAALRPVRGRGGVGRARRGSARHGSA